MALFSEVDWVLLLGVAVLLLLGPEGKNTMRTLGRWYGRAMHLKDELLGQLGATAGLPASALTSRPNVRAFLLGTEGSGLGASAPAIPAPVSAAPAVMLTSVAVRLEPVATACAVAAVGPGSWSWASTVATQAPTRGAGAEVPP
ncbi:MAG: hypothetical protein L3K07_02695 [Thermoplasmata archaeon]|nr:hypothetical protein [Thermoplasmata archaeon]